ncbi:TIGR02757 family protein [Ochrovirga pacifica]|uniref:TIGR02757 family protein n=1 Tax=Ochrovirga pacifica TaxID=1042376 RepID=UPI0002557B5F|nr:TIGR02757 family protein [Ochrovirga pacifica]
MNQTSLKSFLDQKVIQYNNTDFIDSDPVQIPHRYTQKEDIEIAGFLAATISWGKRPMIIKNCLKMMELLENSPYDFILHHQQKDLDTLSDFKHRTFNGIDLQFFIQALHHIYTHHYGLEAVFNKFRTDNSLQPAIHQFKNLFFEIPHPARTTKHISDPNKGSAAKRINMFLRWMVRKDPLGVDLGIWKSIPTACLSCPLDVHTGNVGRKLGLITRKQNDAKTLAELDANLRILDPIDPVKYDFALFGLGVFENF